MPDDAPHPASPEPEGTAAPISSFDDELDNDLFVANGVRVTDGQYLIPPLAPRDLARVALNKPLDPTTIAALLATRRRHAAAGDDTLGDTVLGTVHGVDANNLKEAGWGVIFAADDPDAEAMRSALAPLLALREEQCGRLYKEYIGETGIPADSDGWKFLASLGSAPGNPVDPTIVPYYLMLVASPEQVSFEAQCAMDTQNAVGRLWFDGDTREARLAALSRYAQAVAERERNAIATPPRAYFFAARNKGDAATQRSARFLATPVSKAFASKHGSWQVATAIGDSARKATLLEVLHGAASPSLLVTATHGAAFDSGDPLQFAQQGALVCQDWEGLASTAPLTEHEYVWADDITTAQLPGTIAFLFACYGAGTPATDAFLPIEVTDATAIAPRPFVSRLAQQLLLAGAGAVIGHVERAWTCSFQWPGAGAQTQVFTSLFDALAAGTPVGSAMEYFDARCGGISRQLTDATRAHAAGKNNDFDLSALWTAQMDARNYIVLGDPAVRFDV